MPICVTSRVSAAFFAKCLASCTDQQSGFCTYTCLPTSIAADAMIAVCLAGTIFFSAARSEQRTQVALYLLVTMAPFAVVAPFIGPALDRLQRGRRMALAATALGRGVLAWVMAAQFTNGYALYPAAFGALVLSKAYAVLKGACLPRVLPERMTLVSANARISMFGLAAAADVLQQLMVRTPGKASVEEPL